MNPIRQKMASLLTEAVRSQIEALSSESPLAKQLNEIEDIDAIITEEIEKICNTATLAEIIKISLLINRLGKVTENKQELIKNQLNSIAKNLIKRVENKTGQLMLSDVCLELFSQL